MRTLNKGLNLLLEARGERLEDRGVEGSERNLNSY